MFSRFAAAHPTTKRLIITIMVIGVIRLLVHATFTPSAFRDVPTLQSPAAYQLSPLPDASPSADAGADLTYVGAIEPSLITTGQDAAAANSHCQNDLRSTQCSRDMANIRRDAQSVLTTLAHTPVPPSMAPTDAKLRSGLNELVAGCDAYARWNNNPDDTDALQTFRDDMTNGGNDLTAAGQDVTAASSTL